MIKCYLTRDQILEALNALDIAHSNGWVASKAIFKLTEFNLEKHIQKWEIEKCSIRSDDVYLIIDAGAEDGSSNYGMDSYMYKEETPEMVLERNSRYYSQMDDNS